jgi:hypothetical protein
MAFFSEAVIDPETNELVKNQPFSVLRISDGSTATLYTFDLTGVEGYSEVPQPVLSDENGMLSFWAEPGYYNIDRGGATTLIHLVGDVIADPELTTVFLSNESSQFSPEGLLGVVFSNSYQPQLEITASTVLDNFVTPQTIIYNGASDITLTFPALAAPNGVWNLFQGSTGKITVAVTSPATQVNIDSHTKTAGVGAIGVVINVGTEPETPKYAFGGRTVA